MNIYLYKMEVKIDPLVDELQKKLALVIDVKHLNAGNILDALVSGMRIVRDINTKTDQQKKILLLDVFKRMILSSQDLSQNAKEDLIWVVDEIGPGAVETVLYVAMKGVKEFKKTKCYKSFCCC